MRQRRGHRRRPHPDRAGLRRQGLLSRRPRRRLSAHVIKAIVKRTGIDPKLIEDVRWGCVQQQGEQGYRHRPDGGVIAGLPMEIGGVTINRNCGSSLQASTRRPEHRRRLRGRADRRRRRAHAPHPDGGRSRPQPAPRSAGTARP